MTSFPVGKISALILSLISFRSIAGAQLPAGTLRGQVTDSLGGAIVRATVVVTYHSGTDRTIATDEAGGYAISSLSPGRYAVRVMARGFAPYRQTEVEVAAGRTTRLDIRLNVELEKQEVIVSDESPPDA
jgi:hypothetical protein